MATKNYYSPLPVNPKAKAVVIKSITKLGLRPPAASLDGTMLHIVADAVDVRLEAADIPVERSRLSVGFPSGMGLETRHLLAALRGDCKETLVLLVDMLRGAESHGTTFLEAHPDEIALLLESILDEVIAAARRDRNSAKRGRA